MIHLSRDDRGRLGSFDPGCFTVDFRTDTADTPPGTDVRVLLAHVPDPLLAHEFAHFLHATGTRAGIHNYALSVDYALGLSALTVFRQLARGRDGRTVDQHVMADLHRTVAATVSSMLVASGGVVPQGDAAQHRWLSLCEGVTDQFGGTQERLAVVQTRTGDGLVSRRSVGYRELTEGVGRAVEYIRLQADAPTLDQLIDGPAGGDVLLPIADPYWVAYAPGTFRCWAARPRPGRPCRSSSASPRPP